MMLELSGVQIGLKSYTRFQNGTSAQREFDLKSQVGFQAKIAGDEVQLPLYYFHFTSSLICCFKNDLKSTWLCCFGVPFSLPGKKMRSTAKNGVIWE